MGVKEIEESFRYFVLTAISIFSEKEQDMIVNNE
jgi:hypothetical protein